MKKRLVFRTVALATVGMFLLVGTAFAAEWTRSTKIGVTVSPGTKVDPGDKVTFSGHLKSHKKTCKVGRKVSLVRIGDGVVDKTKTGNHGAYEFSPQRVRSTSDWKVNFNGFTRGVHPNIHTCTASTSKTITITVRS